MNSSTKVIDIKSRLPKMTPSRLINEAKANCDNTDPIPIDTFIYDLPKILDGVLDYLLSDINYLENKSSDQAIAARILATGIFRLTQSLEAIE